MLEAEANRTTDLVCLGCGAMCDDIVASFEGERVAAFEPACALGRDWLESGLKVEPIAAMAEGEPTDLTTAVRKARTLIAESPRRLVIGVEDCSIEAVRAIAAFTELTRARLGSLSAEAVARAVASVGQVSGTLGEVKDRSDVIVFWMCDPIATQPRHASRFSIDAVGRFVRNGRSDRRIIVVDRSETETAKRADLALAIPPELELEALAAVRAMVRDCAIDRDRGRAKLGANFDRLGEVAELLKQARHGAWFWSERETESEERVETILRLVRDLNRGRRFLELPLGDGSNSAGARTALSWLRVRRRDDQVDRARQACLTGAFDVSAGDLAQFDLIVAIGDRAVELMRAHRASQGSGKTPRVIAIAPSAVRCGGSFDVAIRTGALGIRSSGSVMRCDGVILPVPACAPAIDPSPAVLIEKLAEDRDP